MAGRRTFLPLAGAALLLIAPRVEAQPATAGTPVAGSHLAAESNASVLADGLGGAFIGFKIAYRSPSLPAEVAVAHVYASAGRDPDWAALPANPPGSLAQSSPAGPARVVRAPSGMVLTFADFSNIATPSDVVLELGAQGANGGYPGFQPSYSYNTLTVLPRSDGGALILSKATGSTNCLTTVLSPSGAGTEVLTHISLASGNQATVAGDRMAAAPSGVDGAIAVILLPTIDLTATGTDIVAVRVDGAGNAVWTPTHRVLSNAVRDQMDPVAVSDGADGAYIAWRDQRSATIGPDIYGVRLLANGASAAGWPIGAKAVVATTGGQYAPSIASDDAGGAWIAWVDERNLALSGSDIYFTHLLGDGTFASGFITNGRAMCTDPGAQTDVQITRDDSGGLFAVWIDARDGEPDLYALHMDAAGLVTSGWQSGGSPVCTDGTAQARPAVGWVSNGRAIAAWNDSRTGTNIVYAAALDAARGVLDVPRAGAARLALAPRVNPGHSAVELRIDAPGSGEVHVQLFDVSGRLRAERSVSGPVQGAAARFAGLEPGVYLVSAAQADERSTARVAVLR
jgi:hypothetical protein